MGFVSISDPQSVPNFHHFGYTGEAETPGVWQCGEGERNFSPNPTPPRYSSNNARRESFPKRLLICISWLLTLLLHLQPRCIKHRAQRKCNRKALVRTSRHLQQGEPRSRWTDCTARFRPDFRQPLLLDSSLPPSKVRSTAPHRGFGELLGAGASGLGGGLGPDHHAEMHARHNKSGHSVKGIYLLRCDSQRLVHIWFQGDMDRRVY